MEVSQNYTDEKDKLLKTFREIRMKEIDNDITTKTQAYIEEYGEPNAYEHIQRYISVINDMENTRQQKEEIILNPNIDIKRRIRLLDSYDKDYIKDLEYYVIDELRESYPQFGIMSSEYAKDHWWFILSQIHNLCSDYINLGIYTFEQKIKDIYDNDNEYQNDLRISNYNIHKLLLLFKDVCNEHSRRPLSQDLLSQDTGTSSSIALSERPLSQSIALSESPLSQSLSEGPIITSNESENEQYQLINNRIPPGMEYEEDITPDSSIISDSSQIDESSDDESDDNKSDDNKSDNNWIHNNCLNDINIVGDTLNVDDTFTIKILGSQNKFIKSYCLEKSEIIQYLESDLNQVPKTIMSIYTHPLNPQSQNDYISGITAKPTGRFVFRIPMTEIYITIGSLLKILKSENKKWYALPLYNGKRRRIGTIEGRILVSGNHGQVPGSKIYKVFTKDEIKNNTKVIANDDDDYPITLYAFSNLEPLLDILGQNLGMVGDKDVYIINFTNRIILHIISPYYDISIDSN